MSRIETQVVQFGDDWPGLFIRGDNAIAFASAIQQTKAAGTKLPYLLTSLADSLLEVANTKNILKLKEIEECHLPK